MSNKWGDGFTFGCILMTFLSILIFLGIIILTGQFNSIKLSQQSADSVCVKITGNESAIAVQNYDNKLECILPSYDSTQEIIIKTNGDRK